jgi:hypothetical protein
MLNETSKPLCSHFQSSLLSSCSALQLVCCQSRHRVITAADSYQAYIPVQAGQLYIIDTMFKEAPAVDLPTLIALSVLSIRGRLAQALVTEYV